MTETTNTTAVDTQAIQESVAEIYVSTFGRAPDKAGLEYWTNEVVKGNLTLDGVAQSFFDQPETKALYDDASNEDFIISVYENTLNRTVDSNDEGVQYWAGELESGHLSKDTFIKAIVDGAKADTGSADDAALLQNKVKVSLDYAQEIGEADSPLAKQVMEKVTADDTTVEDAMATVNFYKDWVEKYDSALPDDAGITKEELYAHIDDDEYWDNLEEEHPINIGSDTKFWKQDDSLWNDNANDDELDFLDDEDAWADTTSFQEFKEGKFKDISIKSILNNDSDDNDSDSDFALPINDSGLDFNNMSNDSDDNDLDDNNSTVDTVINNYTDQTNSAISEIDNDSNFTLPINDSGLDFNNMSNDSDDNNSNDEDSNDNDSNFTLPINDSGLDFNNMSNDSDDNETDNEDSDESDSDDKDSDDKDSGNSDSNDSGADNTISEMGNINPYFNSNDNSENTNTDYTYEANEIHENIESAHITGVSSFDSSSDFMV